MTSANKRGPRGQPNPIPGLGRPGLPSLAKHSFLLLASLVFIMGGSTSLASAQGTTHYVSVDDPRAADLPDHGSQEQPWKSLAYALTNLKPADTLLVRGGVYRSASVELTEANSGQIDAPITVKAYPGEDVILKDAGAIRFQGASWWTIEGLTFEGYQTQAITLGLHTALGHHRTVPAEHITIRNCVFRDGNHAPIPIHFANHIVIEGNTFKNMRPGIPFYDEKGNRTGYELNAVAVRYMGDDILIQGNRFEEIGSDGVQLGSQSYRAGSDIGAVMILDNEFWVNRPYTGILGNVGENGIDVKKVSGPVRIAGNSIHGFRPTTPQQDASGSNGSGMVVHDDARNLIIEQNLFFDNTIHLTISRGGDGVPSGSRDIVVRNNLLRGAKAIGGSGGFALKVSDIAGVEVVHNTFFDNTVFLRSWRVEGSTFVNNAVHGGEALINADDALWQAGWNAWAAIQAPLPPALQGDHDRVLQDLGLDEDLRPLEGSPLIDAGLDLGVSFDFEGSSRQDGQPDIGAFEYTAPASTFVDVPPDHPYHDAIETLYQAGYTAGCSSNPLKFCPDRAMTRAESAVFVQRGAHGVDVQPAQPASQTFADLPLESWAARWAEALYADGYTVGCGVDPPLYCPWAGHSRAEGAAFYLRMLHGADYTPPDPEGIFADVPVGWWGAKWAEAAYAMGVIPACGQDPLRFCPDDPLTRGLAASMMVQAKGLDNP